MTEQTKTRIPAPLYAAAGASELAYQQLRKLPAVVTELREKATVSTAELRERAAATLKAANETATGLRGKATANELDVERLRTAARRNAKVARVRAEAVYRDLVARGERVVGTGVVQAADTVNADIEATEPPAELTATPADVAAATGQATVSQAPAKPAKATKAPAKRTGGAQK